MPKTVPASGEAARGQDANEGSLNAAESRRRSIARTIASALAFRNISALYVFLVIFVVFSLWIPDLFLSETTWRTLLDQQALTALVAVALVIPLAAGAFDLAIGAEVGFGAILVAWLLGEAGLPPGSAIALTILAGGLIGLISGLLIVRARIDSFIATLGLSSILIAAIQWVSGGEQILNLGATFQELATSQILGVTLPVYIMLTVSLGVWFVLERAPVGRRIYATGGNLEAARLAGVRTSLVIVVSLIACGAIAASAGVLASSRIATGDPTVGPSFLLPAFSAAFLGSTQLRGGRFNVWGTVIAVYVLATGVKGLQLAGAPVWIPDLFNGAALLVAVGLAKYQGRSERSAAIRRAFRLRRHGGSPVLEGGSGGSAKPM